MPLDYPFRARIKRIPGETPRNILARGFYLPAILRGVSWSYDFPHDEYETIRRGQFSVRRMGGRGAPQLLTLDDIETLTLVWNPRWLVDPEAQWGTVRRNLLRLGQAGVPFELMIKPRGLRENVVQRSTLVLQETVTIRSMRIEVREGEPDTEYYTLALKQWRHAGDGRRGVGRPAGGGGHVVREGDTLLSLAMKYFHSYGAADAIARENGLRGWGKSTPLKRHPRFKRRGAKIRIPRIPRTLPIRTGPARG